MANKAVIGVAALGLSAYKANEYYQEKLVEREQEEHQQLEQDRREAHYQHLADRERKHGGKRSRKEGADPVSDHTIEQAFQTAVSCHVDKILFALLLEIGEKGISSQSNINKQNLNFPLISNECEYEKEDIMLAAAFALGDEDLVKKVAHAYPKYKLGIGLKKFSSKSISHIIRILESIEKPEPRIDIDAFDYLNMFVEFGVYDPHFRSGQAAARPLGENIVYSESLHRMAEKCGFNITPMAQFKGIFNYNRRNPKIKFLFKASSDHRRHFGSNVLLSNFRCSFETPVKSIKASSMQSTVVADWYNIHLHGKNANRCSPNLDVIAEIYAKKIAATMSQIAAKRLRFLLQTQCDDHQGLSHEHISVYCGYGGDILQGLAQSDIAMITKNKSKISSIIKASLKNSVAPTDIEGNLARRESLEKEIDSFINLYLRLLNLSYCEIPLLARKPPSAYVPDMSVHNEAYKSTIWSTASVMIHGTRRILEKDELERIGRSRDLAAPRKTYTVVFTIFLWILVSWLWFLTLEKFFPPVCTIQTFLSLLVIKQTFAFSTLYTLVGMIKIPLRLHEKSSHWKVATCCTEAIMRRAAVKLGKPTPFDQEMKRLKETCQKQYREWALRIAKKEFNDALRRKKITSRACFLLLTDLAHSHVESENEEVVEGTFPGTIEEVQEFLNLEIDDQPTATSESNVSTLEAFHDMDTNVEKCLHFAVADRVFVQFDESVDDDDWKPEHGANMSKSTLACRRSRTGSVAACSAGFCYVHFDGEPIVTTTPIPIHLCSLFDENSVHSTTDENSTDRSHSTWNSTRDADNSRSGLANDHEIAQGTEDGEDSDTKSNHENDSFKGGNKVKRERAQTVEEALVQGGWKLVRAKNHIKYSRRVRLPEGETQKQNVTLSKTSSDWRATKNSLAMLRRLNEEVERATLDDHDHIKCSVCGDKKKRDFFSKTQIKKGSNKCGFCTNKGGT